MGPAQGQRGLPGTGGPGDHVHGDEDGIPGPVGEDRAQPAQFVRAVGEGVRVGGQLLRPHLSRAGSVRLGALVKVDVPPDVVRLQDLIGRPGQLGMGAAGVLFVLLVLSGISDGVTPSGPVGTG